MNASDRAAQAVLRVAAVARRVAEVWRAVLDAVAAATLAAQHALGRIAAELRHAAIAAGYAVRPYDMLADARRWRWQPPRRCGLHSLTPGQRERMLAAMNRAHRTQHRG